MVALVGDTEPVNEPDVSVASRFSITQLPTHRPKKRLPVSNNGYIMLHIWRHSQEASMAAINQLAAGIAWEKPADLSSKDVLKRLSLSAVKAFLKIRGLWEL